MISKFSRQKKWYSCDKNWLVRFVLRVHSYRQIFVKEPVENQRNVGLSILPDVGLRKWSIHPQDLPFWLIYPTCSYFVNVVYDVLHSDSHLY